MFWCLIVAIGLALPPHPLHAADDASIGAAADAVVAAHKAGDAKRMQALAASDDPDPWLVADALLARGAAEAAEAFARADGRPEMIFLAAYVRDAPQLETLAASRKALTVLRASGSAEVPAHDDATMRHVPGVRLAYLRGERLSRSNTPAGAAAAFASAAHRARELGWDTFASDALYRAGLVWWMRAEYRRAADLFRKHLEIEEALRSPMGVGRAHFRISSALFPLGDLKNARTHRAESKRLAAESGDHMYAAKCLSDEGVDQARRGERAKAMATFAAAAAALGDVKPDGYPARFRPDPRRVASARCGSLANAASMATAVTQNDRAEAFLRSAVDIAEDSGDQQLIQETQAHLARLIGVREELHGNYLVALTQFERARDLYMAIGSRAELADIYTRLGTVRSSLSDFPRSLQSLDRAIAILTEAGVKRKLMIAHVIASSVGLRMADLESAANHAQIALGLARSLGDPAKIADTLISVSAVHRSRARYGEAIEATNEAIRLLEGHSDTHQRAEVLIELSRIHEGVREHAASCKALEQADELLEGTPWTAKRAAIKQALALSLTNDGRFREALEILTKAEAFHRESGNRLNLAHALMLRADALLTHGEKAEYTTARECFEEARSVLEAIGHTTSAVHARIGLGRAIAWTTGPAEAIPLLEEALKDALELGRPRYIGDAYIALAEAGYLTGADARAMNYARQGAALLRNVGLNLDEETQAAARAQLERLTLWGIAAAIQRKSVPDAYEFLERGRASALVASLGGRAALRAARVPAPLRTAEDEARATAAMAYERLQLARKSGKRKVVRERRAELHLARAAEADAMRAVQRAVRGQVDLAYSKPASLEETQGLLAANERLIVYGADGYQYAAVVIGPKTSRLVKLDAVKTLNPVIEAVSRTPGDTAKREALQQAILGKLELPASVTRLLISPVGRFTYIPYGALEPKRSVSLVPSGTVLGVLRQSKAEPGRHVLAIGNPSYTDRPDPPISYGGRLRTGTLIPLPGTEAEAKAVGDVVLLGKHASETMFRRVLGRQKRWRSVHFACHGLLDDVRATQCALALTHDAQNDGLLHAGELFAQVDVAADLVVLSGCDTGRGRIVSGEGLQGLSRAFMLSGAPRVLASLWKVDDEATRALMTRFYQLWNPKAEGAKPVPAADALREAQAYVRGQPKWQDVKYWGAWVLWGLPE